MYAGPRVRVRRGERGKLAVCCVSGWGRLGRRGQGVTDEADVGVLEEDGVVGLVWGRLGTVELLTEEEGLTGIVGNGVG